MSRLIHSSPTAATCRAALLAFLTWTLVQNGAEAAGAWNHKAVADDRVASRLVGGFSAAGVQEYRAGLAYLRKEGVTIGTYTIAEVVARGKQHPQIAQPGTPREEPPQFSSPLGGLLLLSIVLGGIFWFAGRWNRTKVLSAQQDRAELERERQEAQSGAIVPIPAPAIAAHGGEQFYYCRPNVDVIAEHHHATYIGGYSGVSMRVARGFYLRTGGSRGKKLDSVTLDVDDRGTLYVSNQRVVLVGGRKTVDVPFGRIVSVDAYADGLKLNRSNAAAVVLRTASPGAGILLRRVMARDLASR